MKKDCENNENDDFSKSIIKAHYDSLQSKLNNKLIKFRQNIFSQSKYYQSKYKSLSLSITNQLKNISESFKKNFNNSKENQEQTFALFLQEFSSFRINVTEQDHFYQEEILSQFSTEFEEIEKDIKEIMNGFNSGNIHYNEEYQKIFGENIDKFRKELGSLLQNYRKKLILIRTSFENNLFSGMNSLEKDFLEIINLRKNIDNIKAKNNYKSDF